MVLHSKIVGEGTPFLILHGFLGMGDNWKTLALRFSKLGYQLHLIDQRNHGRSFHSPVFNYEVMASDLEAYCEFHQLENVILLGHSMGGKSSMLFASLYPHRLQKLIVADIAPRFYPVHHDVILQGLSYQNLLNFISKIIIDIKITAGIAPPNVLDRIPLLSSNTTYNIQRTKQTTTARIFLNILNKYNKIVF